MTTRAMLEIAAMTVLLAAQSAVAANYDGGQPFLCAPLDIVSCAPDGKCDKETAQSINLPQFLKFDVAQNQITGTRPNGDRLAAAIDKVQHLEDRMVLQGLEGAIMWSVMVSQDSGDMTLTAGGDRIGFVAFGSCTSD
jgi:hypothetical protein